MSILTRLLPQAITKRWFQSDDYNGAPVSTSWDWNFWQEDKVRSRYVMHNATIEACVQVYCKTLGQMDAYHYKQNNKGGRDKQVDSELDKVLHRPNRYQSWSDFIINLMRSILLEGNAYAIAERDGSDKIVALHLISPYMVTPRIIREIGDVYYEIAADQTEFDILPDRLIPQRDILHVRAHTPVHPLVGETPLTSASLAIHINESTGHHQAAFFDNMARPSGALESDQAFTPDQMDEVRKAWKEHSTGASTGGVPFLTRGLKWKPMTLSSADAQLIEAQKMSIQEIARVMHVPLPLIGVMEGSTYSNTEQLMSYFLSTSLNFYLRHIERAFDDLFNLPRNESMDFDSDALLRVDLKARVESLTRAITGGLMSPNEARRREHLPDVEGGELPRVQMQMVGLDFDPNATTEAAANDAPEKDSTENDDKDDDNKKDDSDMDDKKEGKKLSLEQSLLIEKGKIAEMISTISLDNNGLKSYIKKD